MNTNKAVEVAGMSLLVLFVVIILGYSLTLIPSFFIIMGRLFSLGG